MSDLPFFSSLTTELIVFYQHFEFVVSYLFVLILNFFQTTCEDHFGFICLVKVERVNPPIFGFAEFLAALAVLVVLYTFGDAIYKFRSKIAILPVSTISFVILFLLGIFTLLSDLIVQKYKLWPQILPAPDLFQATLGFTFIALIAMWLCFSFIKPPKFTKYNYRKYHQVLYNYIVRGNEEELQMLAYEVGRSASNLIKYAKNETRNQSQRQPNISDYANEVLLMIADARFCNKVVSSCPNTAIIFATEVTRQRKYGIPIGPFLQKISQLAISNTHSLLYHEGDDGNGGLLTYTKPLSHALYGNIELLKALGSEGPLDIDYKSTRRWHAEQYEVYCKAVLLALRDYLELGDWYEIPAVLHRAIGNIENSSSDLYELNDVVKIQHEDDRVERLRVAINFITDASRYVEKYAKLPQKIRKSLDKKHHQYDPLDRIAKMMFEIVLDAASISRPDFEGWHIQHNTVWNEFSWQEERNTKVGKALLNKFSRLMYEEIKDFQTLPNYKNAKIIGFCLNVMGFENRSRTGLDKPFLPLQRLMLRIVKENFLKVMADLPDVAHAALMGTISFDEKNKRLVKTYIKGLHREAPQDYFDLETGKFSRSRDEKRRTESAKAKPKKTIVRKLN